MNMTQDEENLLERLNNWFESVDSKARLNKRNFWSRNEIAKTIKRKMTEWKRWKNKGRGNPLKGGKAAGIIENNDW